MKPLLRKRAWSIQGTGKKASAADGEGLEKGLEMLAGATEGFGFYSRAKSHGVVYARE